MDTCWAALWSYRIVVQCNFRQLIANHTNTSTINEDNINNNNKYCVIF